jgi:chromosome segregation ATPase
MAQPRTPGYTSVHYNDPNYDANPFKSAQNLIKEERQYNINTTNRVNDSMSHANGYSTPHHSQLHPRVPNDTASQRMMASTYVSTKQARTTANTNRYGGTNYDLPDPREMAYHAPPEYYASTHSRGSYVPSIHATPTHHNQSYMTSRRSYIDEYRDEASRETAITQKEMRAKEMTIDKLKVENEKLLKDLHKFKKIEAGLAFGGSNKKIIENTELREKNIALIQEINQLKATIVDLSQRAPPPKAIEEENIRLKTIISKLEHENKSLISEIDHVRNTSNISPINTQHSIIHDQVYLRDQLEEQKRRVDNMRSEITRLSSENQNLKAEVQRSRGNEMKVTSQETVVSRLNEKIAVLEAENRRLGEQYSSVKTQTQISIQERERDFENDRKYNTKLREDYQTLQNNLKIEAEKNRLLIDEMDSMRSKIVQLEVQSELNQRKVCPYHSDDDIRRNDDNQIFGRFKSKLEEKTKEVNELYHQIDGLKNENQDLRTRLTTLEVQHETMISAFGRKERDLVSKYQIEMEDLKNNFDFLTKENMKLRELLRKTDSHVNKVEIVRNINTTEDPLLNDPNIERLLLKALMSDFEFHRLKHNNQGSNYNRVQSNMNKNRAPVRDNGYPNQTGSLMGQRENEGSYANPMLMSHDSQKLDRLRGDFESFDRLV